MKKKYHIIESLKNIEHTYSTYLIDVVGVISDGKAPFNDVIEAINYLLKKDKQIIFLSNNPRPAWFTETKLRTFGITGNYHTVTSGDLLHHTLKTTLADKKIYHLGRNRQHALLEGTNTHITTSLSDADAIILSCFVEGDEDHTIFDKDLEEIINSNKPIYCPNPDQLTFQGNILRYPSGYFAHKLTQRGCPITYLGKPSRIIYDFITHIHPHINFTHDTTLMIGDTLETDICGAINFSIDSLLVLSGITGLLTKNNTHAIAQSPYQPTYIIEKLLQ
jgi:HAD superfamily hydrolase (TIGR01459 family)